jgi:FrmR/RcnR family transcriptional regulator, repressor of frmRAB operon
MLRLRRATAASNATYECTPRNNRTRSVGHVILRPSMSHGTYDRRLLSRIRRIKGQIESLERAVSEGQDCYAVLQQTAAARGALNGLTAELIESHVRFHTLQTRSSPREANRKVEELMTVIRSYLR